MTPLTVCAWKWGNRFSALHVNVLRLALERHLQFPHAFVCVTDDSAGIDPRVTLVKMPTQFAQTPRCRRRMQQYDRTFSAALGRRILYIDLDVVIVSDLTALLSREEPLVCYRVEHAGVYSGSFVLADAGVLHDAWAPFAEDPTGYPARIQARGVASDQAMVNYHLRNQTVPHWTSADGLISYYGAGYERLEHYGVGPSRPDLPAGAKIVVLGSADLDVLEQNRFPWVQEHWTPLADACRRRAA